MRLITKWTKACDKRLNRLISYIHHTSEDKQYCYVGNTSKQSRLGLFQDSDFAGDLEDTKSTSGGTFCVFGSHTIVSISWMCKKQISFSHSSTESEIISVDAGLRLDGSPARDLWDMIVAVLGNTNQHHTEQGDLLKNKREVSSPPHTIHKRKQSQSDQWCCSEFPNSESAYMYGYVFHDTTDLSSYNSDGRHVVHVVLCAQSPTPAEMRRQKYVVDGDLRESADSRANPRDTFEDQRIRAKELVAIHGTIELRNDDDSLEFFDQRDESNY